MRSFENIHWQKEANLVYFCLFYFILFMQFYFLISLVFRVYKSGGDEFFTHVKEIIPKALILYKK